MAKLPKTKIAAIRFDYRDMEKGFFVEFEIPYTQHNWEWVLAHPNTAFIRKIRKAI